MISVNWRTSSYVALNHFKILRSSCFVLPLFYQNGNQAYTSWQYIVCQCAEILSWANVVATSVPATFIMQLYMWLQNINICSINSQYLNLLPQGQLLLPTPFTHILLMWVNKYIHLSHIMMYCLDASCKKYTLAFVSWPFCAGSGEKKVRLILICMLFLNLQLLVSLEFLVAEESFLIPPTGKL